MRQASRFGRLNANWKGGLTIRKDGRVLIKMRDHPNSDKRGYIFRYRLVMEQKLGRRLKRGELIHHIDGDCTNDDPNNLELSTFKEHIKLHGICKSKQKLITFRNKRMNIREWAAHLGLGKYTLYQRLAAGWPLEKALCGK